jgi:hypothetical protein
MLAASGSPDRPSTSTSVHPSIQLCCPCPTTHLFALFLFTSGDQVIARGIRPPVQLVSANQAKSSSSQIHPSVHTFLSFVSSVLAASRSPDRRFHLLDCPSVISSVLRNHPICLRAFLFTSGIKHNRSRHPGWPQLVQPTDQSQVKSE